MRYSLRGYALSIALFLIICSQALAISENEKWFKGFNLPGTNNIITALDADSQYIYAAGLFTRITGGSISCKLARFDGVEWQAFPDTSNGPTFPMEMKVRNGIVWVADTRGLLKYDNGWTLVANTNNLPIYDFDFDPAGNIYVTGSFTSINGVNINGVAKYNGTAWASLGSGLPVSSQNEARAIHCLGGEVYLAGPFNNVGGISCNGFAKWNGISWTQLNTGGMVLGMDSHFCEFNNELYLSALSSPTGFNGSERVFKWNGSTLVQLGGTFNSGINHLRIINNRLCALGYFSQAGSTNANRIASWNGTGWTDEGQGLNFDVFDIAENTHCTMVAGSDTPFGTSFYYRYAAIKTGDAWIPTGNGMNGNVNAILAHGNKVYAAGNFTDAGGINARVVCWDGLKWDSLSGGLNLRVIREIAVFRDTIYIGGSFTDPQTLSGHYIAKWDGSQWISIPGDVNYEVFALAVYNNELYVGGSFTSMGAGPANQIVKYDGLNWTNLSSLTNGTVKDIQFDQNGVMYVGGGFTTIGGIQARRIAKYTSGIWSEVGSGVDQYVNAIGISPNNELYIGGQFYLGYNVGVLNHLAKFNGTSLQAVSGGLGTFSDNIYNIRFMCGKMYATGVFRINGTDTLNNIAYHDGVSWHAMGDGLQHDTISYAAGLCMDIQNNRLWVGGNFSFAGGSRSDKIACYSDEGEPLLSIKNTNSSSCTGDTISFVFHGKNLGNNPQLLWFLNSVSTGVTDTVFQLYPANEGDVVSLKVITVPTCGNPDTLESKQVVVHLTPLAPPVLIQSGSVFTVSNPDALSEHTWQKWYSSAWTGLTPATIGNSFTATAPGQYRVRAAKSNCIRFSSPANITSQQEIQELSAVPVCIPNPTSSYFNLEHIKGYEILELKDISGRLLNRRTTGNTESLQINIENYPAGTYFVTLIGKTKTSCTIKVTKE